MISQISSLVQASKRKSVVGLHVAGGALGGAIAGALLGFVGLALHGVMGSHSGSLALAVPVMLTYVGLSDLRVLRLPYFTSVRQTPGSWSCALGARPALFAWGVDLGLGFTTRLPYQAILVLPLFAVLMGRMLVSILIMMAYGAARAGAVAGAILSWRGGVDDLCDAVLAREGALKRAVGVASICLALLFLPAV